MNLHQHKLWVKMISMIDNYLTNSGIDFYDLVGELEGTLDAAEIKDEKLIHLWYEYWTPLEIRRSIEGNLVNKEKAKTELIAMKDFLKKEY